MMRRTRYVWYVTGRSDDLPLHSLPTNTHHRRRFRVTLDFHLSRYQQDGKYHRFVANRRQLPTTAGVLFALTLMLVCSYYETGEGATRDKAGQTL